MKRTNANNANTTPNSARDAYQARTKDIARLIGLLQAELAQHAQAAEADPKCWGRVGDLGKVRSDLLDLVGFMKGMDREDLEAALGL